MVAELVSERRGRLPPQDVDAECSVLGAMLLEPQAANEVLSLIKAEDFYRPAHARIFESMSALYERSEPIDEVTVSADLRARSCLDAVGGVSYLASLTERVPSAANVLYYANIVQSRALTRRLIQAATAIAGSGYEGSSDIDALLDEAQAKIFEITSARENRGFASLREVVRDAFKTIEKLFEKKEAVTGVATGFTDLDQVTAGLQPSDLVILAGRPSMGKTALALGIAQNAATRSGTPVAVFSLEMSKEQLVMRMLCSEARVDSQRVRAGGIKETDWPRLAQAAGVLADAPLFIDDTGSIAILEMRAKARRLQAEKGLGLIVVDYLQLMRGRGSGSEGREREISEISRGLKALAKELRVPVVALSQLNRSLEQRQDKRPVLSDLRECVVGDTPVCLADGRSVKVRDLVGEKPHVWAMGVDEKPVVAHAECVWSVGVRPVYKVLLKSGRCLRATEEHRVYSSEGWCVVGSLVPGAAVGVLDASLSGVLSWDSVVSVVADGEEEVFDLTVPGPESWLADGIVSHNSGAIEQDADVIMFVYRDEYYNPTSEDKGVAEVIIGKQRNGPTGTVKLKFFKEYTRFENAAQGHG